MVPPRHPRLRPQDGRHRTARRWAVMPIVLLMAIVAASVAIAGCSPQRHYALLSFFFDGVPHPDGDPLAGDDTALAASGRGGIEVATVFYHQPYLQGRDGCVGCHDLQRGYEAATRHASTCASCHSSHVNPVEHDWVHGAVVFGDCGQCHEPHSSQFARLLTNSQPQICFDCHDPGYFQRDGFHSQLADLTCSRCHDPHASGNRLLLADSRTYARRRDQPIVSEHLWTREECRLCHQVARGNVVVDDVDAVCQSCHSNAMQSPAGQPMHQAVVDGRCTACHTPHQSIRPALIKPTAEQVCSGCHDPAQLPRPQHPVVMRGDCLMCHSGHWSDRPRLLKPNIAGPGRNDRAATTASLRTNWSGP
jgi:predicted CXXCH cytochrome family protein